jgi:hypothetical protein
MFLVGTQNQVFISVRESAELRTLSAREMDELLRAAEEASIIDKILSGLCSFMGRFGEFEDSSNYEIVKKPAASSDTTCNIA